VKTVNEKLTIGKISKYWSGFVNDVFTNADNFGIHVPGDLDVTVKAAMIGACFLFVSLVLERIGDFSLSDLSVTIQPISVCKDLTHTGCFIY
jgi:hypothetical protein